MDTPANWRDTLVEERGAASGAELAVDFGKEADRVFACGRDGAEFHQDFCQFWMVVRPTPRADLLSKAGASCGVCYAER